MGEQKKKTCNVKDAECLMVQTKKKIEPWDELGRKKRKEEGKRTKGKVKKGRYSRSRFWSGQWSAAAAGEACSAGEERKRKRNSPRIARASALDGRTLQSPVVSLPAEQPSPPVYGPVRASESVRSWSATVSVCTYRPHPSRRRLRLTSSPPFRLPSWPVNQFTALMNFVAFLFGCFDRGVIT